MGSFLHHFGCFDRGAIPDPRLHPPTRPDLLELLFTVYCVVHTMQFRGSRAQEVPRPAHGQAPPVAVTCPSHPPHAPQQRRCYATSLDSIPCTPRLSAQLQLQLLSPHLTPAPVHGLITHTPWRGTRCSHVEYWPPAGRACAVRAHLRQLRTRSVPRRRRRRRRRRPTTA
jgi:hypothetical protein